MLTVRLSLLCIMVLAFGLASQAQQFRTITIQTEPNAKVWIDNVLYGTTSKDGRLEIKTVAAGTHTHDSFLVSTFRR